MKHLLLISLLLLGVIACTKEADPQPTQHPQKADLHGSWLPADSVVFTLHEGSSISTVQMIETHVYEYAFHGDSVTTWYDNASTETRRLRYPLLLPDGMEHSHIDGSSSKSEFEVVRLASDTLQLRAVYDYARVYRFGGRYYNTTRSELLLTFVRVR